MKKAGFIKSFIVFVLIFALIFGAFKWGEKKLYWNTQATRYYTYAREEKE